jgi:ABC-type polysaccharide/polyol phosphate export permease
MVTSSVYAPHGEVRSRRFVDLIRVTAIRALMVRYRGTAFGVLWSFANPVLMTLIYTGIFGTAFKRYYDGSLTRYLVSAFVGLVVVSFFLAATNDALPSIVNAGSLMNKIAIPPIVFPIAAVAANLFQQLVTTFPILFVLSIVLTRDPARVALVPVVLAAVVVLSAGFALGLAALFVFFRDLPHLWQVAGFILWLSSPLFYPIQLVPPQARLWFSLNPMGQAIAATREVTIARGPLDLHPVLYTVAAALVALALGAWLFRATRDDFMDLL